MSVAVEIMMISPGNTSTDQLMSLSWLLTGNPTALSGLTGMGQDRNILFDILGISHMQWNVVILDHIITSTSLAKRGITTLYLSA